MAVRDRAQTRAVMRLEGYERVRLRKVASQARGKTLLDIGYAHKPNPYYPPLHRVGVDLLRPVHASGYEEEILGDANELAGCLGSRRFDTIVAGELIEHLENPYGFLRSLREFLTADGRVVLSTPNPVAWPVIFFEMCLSRKYFYSQGHVFYFTPRWVMRMLEHSGFVVESVIPVGLFLPLPRVVLPCPVGLSYHVIYVARSRADPIVSS